MRNLNNIKGFKRSLKIAEDYYNGIEIMIVDERRGKIIPLNNKVVTYKINIEIHNDEADVMIRGYSAWIDRMEILAYYEKILQDKKYNPHRHTKIMKTLGIGENESITNNDNAPHFWIKRPA